MLTVLFDDDQKERIELDSLITAFSQSNIAPVTMEEFGAAHRILNKFDNLDKDENGKLLFPIKIEFSDVEAKFLKKIITPPNMPWTMAGVKAVFQLFVKLGWEKDLIECEG